MAYLIIQDQETGAILQHHRVRCAEPDAALVRELIEGQFPGYDVFSHLEKCPAGSKILIVYLSKNTEGKGRSGSGVYLWAVHPHQIKLSTQEKLIVLLKKLGKIGAEQTTDIDGMRKFEAILPTCFTGPRPMFYYIGKATVWIGPRKDEVDNITANYDKLISKDAE